MTVSGVYTPSRLGTITSRPAIQINSSNNISFQWKADLPPTGYADKLFSPVTLTLPQWPWYMNLA